MTHEEKIAKMDKESARMKGKLGVLVTAHHGQKTFMKTCLESINKLNAWTIMVFDNPGDLRHWPKQEIFNMIDGFYLKHDTRIFPGPAYPQFFNFRHGANLLQTEYIFVIGADSVLESPEGLSEIFRMLGDGDIIACSTKNPERHGQAFIGTKSFLVKTEKFREIMNWMEKTFIPFDMRYGNFENRMGQAIEELEIKEVKPENPFDDQLAYKYDKDGNVDSGGTWAEVLGFRHLRGEQTVRQRMCLRPVEAKFFDTTYSTKEEIAVLKYWSEKDPAKQREILEAWWNTDAQGKKLLEEMKGGERMKNTT